MANRTKNKLSNDSTKAKLSGEFYTFLNNLMRFINEWGTFVEILLKPASLFLILLSFAAIYFTSTQSGNIRFILEILSGLITAFAGGIIAYYFFDHIGNTLVVKKSIGAIRNLQLIKSKIENINERISAIGIDESGEVSNLVGNIHKDILNSISDWADVNPNAEVITDFYEVITSANKKVAILKKEKEDLETQKEKIGASKTQEIQKLTKEIDTKNSEISSLNDKIINYQQRIGTISTSSFSPSLSPSASSNLAFGPLKNKTCIKCGSNYFPVTDTYGLSTCPLCGALN